MTTEQLRQIIRPLRAGDKLTVVALPGRLPRTTFDIYLDCNRSVWKRPGYAGLSCKHFVGTARTRDGAERRGNKLIRQITKLRDEQS